MGTIESGEDFAGIFEVKSRLLSLVFVIDSTAQFELYRHSRASCELSHNISMSIAKYIKDIGRGKEGARSVRFALPCA
jgi:hypothetical protein